MRERVPSHYFVDPRVFANSKTAYPMLVYRASRPFRGKMRTELTYDILHPKTVAMFFRTVRPVLGEVLEAAKARLLSDGLTELAALYEPARANAILESVQRLSKSRKCLYVLIRAESVLVTTLIDLASLGNLPIDSRPAGWRRSKRSGDTNCAGCILQRILPGWLANSWRPPRRRLRKPARRPSLCYWMNPSVCSVAAG